MDETRLIDDAEAGKGQILNKYKKILLDNSNTNKFNRFVGVEFIELDENYSITRTKLTDNICNPYGFAHGGALLAIADTSAGVTACMCGNFVVTVSSSMNFLNPGIDTEYIYCECTKLKDGGHLLIFDVKLKDDKGNILDSGEYSFFKTDRKVLE